MAKPIRTAGNPIRSGSRHFLPSFRRPSGKLLLTLPGRITRLKGHEDFIELIARLKRRGLPVHGLIAGGASASKQRYLQKLRYRVRSMGLEADISFTGQRDDLKNILAMSNLVLSLSTQPESFGRTTLEALRLGVPTAGYDHGGVGEILRTIYPAGLLPLGRSTKASSAWPTAAIAAGGSGRGFFPAPQHAGSDPGPVRTTGAHAASLVSRIRNIET